MSELRLINVDQIEEPGTRFVLGECIGSGIRAKVYEATDTKQSNKKVAIKVQILTEDNEICIQEELRILKQFSNHPNLPEFYGIFKQTNKEGDTEIWFAMEFCEGGSVMDLVRKLHNKNRRMQEDHIAFILKETLNALAHLHRNYIIHRNICGDNILLTKEGEIKLIDFGLARSLSGALGKRQTCIGSPCYLAPEVVACSDPESENSYESRTDVWALGITAIELGDGKPPLYGMHPTRILFQIVRNPPPGLYRPGNWSEPYNDFISECLEKNPDYRPFMEELSEHPFFTNISENCYYLNQELKKLIEDLSEEEKPTRQTETIVKDNLIITDDNSSKPVKMVVEDLAALENIDEDRLIEEIKARYMHENFHSFIGDILLVLNPNETKNIYNEAHHIKYNQKSQSANPPHIFSIADRAYQDALHQEVPQQILLSGESGSGKTTAMKHLIDHLLFMGQSKSSIGNCVENALNTILAFTNASTKNNTDSTRCVMKTSITYGASGKVSGAIFHVWQLEKWRISSTDLSQGNFHILYYFYDAMSSSGTLNKYSLNSSRSYRYFRISSEDNPNLSEPRNNPEKNIQNFDTITEYLKGFEFTDDQMETIYKTLAAILLIGEIRFKDNHESKAEIENKEVCSKVAELLQIEEKKLMWALANYCFIEEGSAVKRKNTSNQARDSRDMLANCFYARLVDWIVNILNTKMVKGRAMYGEKYTVNIYDYFGFECFKRNDLEQLLVNTFNEQIQYLYVNRVFAWETMELEEEEIPPPVLNYYNNKRGVDMLLGKPNGLLALIEAGTKSGHNYQHILDTIERSNKSPHINTVSEKDFNFSHYTGKVRYDIREMTQKNRDFLSPEIIDTLRLSNNETIREFFSGKLTKTGNLICKEIKMETSKWNAALIAEHDKQKKLSPDTQYSQTKQLRTAITTFRSVSLEMLRELSVGAGSGGTHFVKCIRSNLTDEPNTFHKELIRHQLRALSILDTVRARQLGFPHRVTFSEFLRRYQFLAFDFEETVDITQENCRLLLIRLKMEGWVIGRSKVFLKYYNEEYLSRLYETKVKKIIKIQCMMRAFMARKSLASKLKSLKNKATEKVLERQPTGDLGAEAAAALLIQKAYRGYNVRKKCGPLINKDSGQLDTATADFIKPFAKKWKNKSMFQVLLQYRSKKFQDLINFSQQIHIFNQNLMHEIQKCNEEIDLEKIDVNAKTEIWLGDKRPTVWKLPFRFDEIPYYDTNHMCDASGNVGEDHEQWDSPLEWRRSIINEMKTKNYGKPVSRAPTPNIQPCTTDQALLNMPYTRDPSEQIYQLPKISEINPTTTRTVKPSNYKPIGKIQQPANQIIISPKNIGTSSISNPDRNFEGANQDFEFIRLSDPASRLKRRSANPIAELESIGRKNTDRSDDEPPFNFQGMLRKTNFQRESFKRTQQRNDVQFNKMEKNRINRQNADVICTELLPGVILEGVETNI